MIKCPMAFFTSGFVFCKVNNVSALLKHNSSAVELALISVSNSVFSAINLFADKVDLISSNMSSELLIVVN